MYNVLIGGAAGQGIDTAVSILEKVLKASGYSVFTSRDFMSRIRGGHNFSLVRFGSERVFSHDETLDGIVALDEETVRRHTDELKPEGFIVCDTGVETDDARAEKVALSELAKAIGNARVAGSIAVGVVLKLFRVPLDAVEDILHTVLDAAYLEMNSKAIQMGYEQVDERYPYTGGSFDDWMILSGSTAVALGALAAGMTFYTAYPMSPATAIMTYLASVGDEAGILVEQAEDEIAAVNMAIGASFAGAKSMTATSGGGFSLMVEALGLAGITETPLVLVNVQRPGPATGLPTRTEQGDLKFMIAASQGEFPRMVLAPRTHEDAYRQTIRAFHLAEKYQMPVILLSDQYLGDATATVQPFSLPETPIAQPASEHAGEYRRYVYTDTGISPRMIPGETEHLVAADSDEHDESGKITESADVRIRMADKRMRKLDLLQQELEEPEFIGPDAFDTLLIGWGSMYGPLVEAVDLLNAKKKETYAALVFGDVFPLPQKELKRRAEKAGRIINVEQNATGQLAGVIREHTGIVCTDSVLKYDGRQMTGAYIARRIGGDEHG